MWACECGCQGIAAGLSFCPMCRKDKTMPTNTSGGYFNPGDPHLEPERIDEAVEETLVQAVDEPAGETQAEVKPQPTTAEVRAWARENNIPVNDRGAIPAALIQQYQEATNG